MKRKLRIFSNIAIICLSICMFAFGVYAANTVSVTTSGTVSFSATGIHANITRTVTNVNETIASFSEPITASVPDKKEYKALDNQALTFKDPTQPISVTIEIENLASDRNIDFVITDVNADISGTNITKECKVSANMYDQTNKKYNVNPQVDGVDNTETITFVFTLNNRNLSAQLSFNYSIAITSQTTINDSFEDTATVKKYGNTFVATTEAYKTSGQTENITVLETGKALNGYTVNGTTDYYEQLTELNTTKDSVVSSFHIYGEGVTGISANIIDIPSYLSFSVSSGSAGVSDGGNFPASLIIPMAINDTDNGFAVVDYVARDAYCHASGNISVTLPNSIKVIKDRAFSISGTLTSINLPDSLEEIHEWALNSYGGTSITIPKNVNVIGNGFDIFNYATELTSIFVDKNNLYYTSTDANNMIVEIATKTLVTTLKNITTFTIPDYIKVLGCEAFYHCSSLTSLVLPASVSSICDAAFGECLSLKEITINNKSIKFGYRLFGDVFFGEEINYVGTMADWNAIEGLSDSGMSLVPTIHCSDGDIVNS